MRVAPLAALVAIVVALVAARAIRTPTPHASASVELSAASNVATRDAAPAASAILAAHDASVAQGAARMLHGDARHTHRARGAGPRAPEPRWDVDLGGPVEAQVVASPDEQTLYVASLAGTLTAIGVDGKKRWSASLGDRVYSTPCVGADGTIYVGSDAKQFFALSPSGQVKWKLELDADADTGAVLAKDGAIVFAAGQTLYAVRPGGDVAWRFRAKKKIFASPALTAAGRVVFGAQDRTLYALEPGGALAWSTALGADVDTSVAIADDGAIYAGTDGGDLVRVSDRGEIVWRTPLGGFVRGALSVARNGDVLAGVYGPTPRLVRVGPDGAVRFTFAIQGTGSELFGVHGGALEDDEGVLYFGGQDDFAYAISPEGRLLWRFSTHGDVDAPLTLLADRGLVVPSDDGHVYLLGR